jgi:hypothetical protein
MLKTTCTIFLSFLIGLSGFTQKLTSFTATLQPQTGNSSYLSVSQKKVFSTTEAKNNKATIDLALVITQSGNSQVMEWYNMTGKDDKIPADLRGTATGISGMSWDKDQFDHCNTTQDLQRMAGYLTTNSFVHFASITDDLLAGGVKYHCFLILMENGKKALLWLEQVDANNFKVSVKAQ